MELSIIISSVIVSIAVIIILRLFYQSKERRALIEKGLDPSLVNIYSTKNNRKLFLFSGILLLAVSLGIITGIILASLFQRPTETKEFILLSVLIITGVSLFVCYHLSGKKMN